MPQLPENTTYTQQGNIPTRAFAKSAMALGQAVKSARPSAPSSFQPKRYSNLTSGLSGLGTQTVPYGGSTRYEKTHPGVDIANKIGTPIPTFFGGTVSKVVGGQKQGSPGFGKCRSRRDPLEYRGAVREYGGRPLRGDRGWRRGRRGSWGWVGSGTWCPGIRNVRHPLPPDRHRRRLRPGPGRYSEIPSTGECVH